MTTDVNNPVAEPSAAAPVVPAVPAAPATPQFNPSDQHTWSPEQREHWNKTGNIPESPKKAESDSAASPASKADSEAKAKTAADTETAQGQETKERKPGEKKGADERIAEVIAERNAEKAERQKLEERLRKLESAAQPTSNKTEPAAKPSEALKRPNLLTWKGTPEEFDKAMDDYEKQRDGMVAAEVLKSQRVEAAKAEMKAKLDDAKTRYPDAEERITQTGRTIFEDKQMPNAIKALFDESDVLPDLLYVLGDAAKLAEFVEKAHTQPGKALRELVVMESLVREELKKPASKTETTAAAAATKEPPAEPKPRAPKPPSEVGGRGATPEDPRLEAARAGDYRAFEAEENRRRFQAK